MSNMKYKGYVGSAAVDVDSEVCHGRILFIRDVISYSADAPGGLKAAFEAAVDDYLETCKALGRKPEKPCSGTFNVRVSQELHMAASLEAKRVGVSLNAIVIEALAARLGAAAVRFEHAHTVKVELVKPWQQVDMADAMATREAPAWSH